MIPTKDQKADLITNAAIEAAAKEHEHDANDPYAQWMSGALWMQAEMEKLIEQREREAWDAAREPRKWTQVFGPQSHIPEGQRYETFEDWKKQNAL